MTTMIERDNERRDQAIARMSFPKGVQDPINNLSRLFEQPLDVAAAAAEVGVSAVDLREVIGANPRLGRKLGNLRVDGGRVSRDQFLAVFGELAVEAQRGVVAFSFVKTPQPGTVFEYLLSKADGSRAVVERKFIGVSGDDLIFQEFIDGQGPTRAVEPRVIARKELTQVELKALGKNLLTFVEEFDHDVWSEERFVSPKYGLVKLVSESDYTGTQTLELRNVVAP